MCAYIASFNKKQTFRTFYGDCPVWLGLGNRMVSLLLAKGRMLAVWLFVQDLRLLPFSPSNS